MKTKINFIFLLEIVGVILVLIIGLKFALGGQSFQGNSPSESRVLSTATTTVGPSGVVTIATDRTNCAGILITTADRAVNVSFDDTAPTASVGHLLASSTNSYFGADEYGCGEISAFGLVASSTITISEFIW